MFFKKKSDEAWAKECQRIRAQRERLRDDLMIERARCAALLHQRDSAHRMLDVCAERLDADADLLQELGERLARCLGDDFHDEVTPGSES